VSTALLLLLVAAFGLLSGALLDVLADRLAGARRPPAGPDFPWRRPLVQVATAVLFAAVVAVHRGSPDDLVLGLVLAALLVPVSLIDLDHRIIPNQLTLPAALLVIVLGTALDPGGEVERIVAGVAAGSALALPSLLHPRGMGMGDAKLAAVLGLFLGTDVVPALAAAFLAGALAGVVVMVGKGVAEGRRTLIPFGPFLALGGVVGVLAGDEIVRLYSTAL
jgi:leader peptidase (prepilin peptidase)/N-methyltransferase